MQEKEEQRVLFINVAKIAMNAGVVIAIAGIIFLIVRGIIRYRKKHPNWRANWKRERRRRKNRVRHMDIHKSARKQRKQYIISDKRRERGRRKISRRFK